eukprot:GHVR01073969.1.p1 GENE.GHVR01073969.1~~GHVR01073969.1.p1  ORF type:complete len:110 (+),score=2.08 GHVR01073969.1:1528-1857(+)
MKSFSKIIKGVEYNEEYVPDCNVIQQWIAKIVTSNPALQQYLLQQTEMFNYLLKLTAKRIPSEEAARKNNVYQDYTINKLHGLKFPNTKKKYAKLYKEMENFYIKLKEK